MCTKVGIQQWKGGNLEGYFKTNECSLIRQKEEHALKALIL